MKKTAMVWVSIFVSVILLSGCGAGGKVDANRPIDQIVAESQTMTVADLQNVIKSYQDVIASKKLDIEKIASKLKEIPLAQMLGEDAKKLKADISVITTTVNSLTERMNVYLKELKSKGGTL